MNKLKLYQIKDDYIKHLRKFEPKVMENKPQGKRRPYVGAVIEINGFKYYVPLTSPKEKHLTMKNSLDFLKINGGIYGAMNINNMIPVNDKDIIQFDIKTEVDETYKNILENQARFIKSNSKKIIDNAGKLYDRVVIRKQAHYISKCNDFKLLEEKCKEYNLQKDYA